MDTTTNIVSTELAGEFVFAGRARFRLMNPVSGASFMLHVARKEDKKTGRPPVFFVRDEDGYLGFVPDNDRKRLVAGRNGRPDAPAFKAFAWLIRHMDAFEPAKIQHLGQCARCALELTDPVSMATGFGPVCCKALGITRAVLPESVDEHDVACAKAIANEVELGAKIYPFRTEEQAREYINEKTDDGLLTVDEAVEMFQAENIAHGRKS